MLKYSGRVRINLLFIQNTWDGHSSSAEAAARAARANITLNDQIKQIHQQKGLIPDRYQEKNNKQYKIKFQKKSYFFFKCYSEFLLFKTENLVKNENCSSNEHSFRETKTVTVQLPPQQPPQPPHQPPQPPQPPQQVGQKLSTILWTTF